MSQWTLIAIAAVSNVLLNLCLRQVGKGVSVTSAREFVLSLLLSPWAWASGLSAVVLLTAFVAAVRSYSLSLTYTAVTALAMCLLTIVSVALRYETVSAIRVVGLVLIIAGLVLSAKGS